MHFNGCCNDLEYSDCIDPFCCKSVLWNTKLLCWLSERPTFRNEIETDDYVLGRLKEQ